MLFRSIPTSHLADWDEISLDKRRQRVVAALRGASTSRDYEPKPKQIEALMCLASGQHVFLRAPTGYGKSLVVSGYAQLDPNALLIVIVPTDPLGRDQVSIVVPL